MRINEILERFTNFWFNPITGAEFKSNNATHTEIVINNSTVMGIEIPIIRDVNFDDHIVMKALSSNWVRVSLSSGKTLSLSIQAIDKQNLLKAARHYCKLYPVTVLYYDIEDYEMEIYKPLHDDDLKVFLKTGKIPLSIT